MKAALTRRRDKREKERAELDKLARAANDDEDENGVAEPHDSSAACGSAPPSRALCTFTKKIGEPPSKKCGTHEEALHTVLSSFHRSYS